MRKKGEGILPRIKEWVWLRWSHETTREWVVILILIVGASFSIVYANVQTYDPVLTPKGGYPDTDDYIAIYHGQPGSGVRAYRPLVPWLARLVPDMPNSFFGEKKDISQNFQIAAKFGVVNFVFLVGACAALYLLHRKLGFSFSTAIMGLLFFLGSTTIVRSAGLPMTDTAFLFFLLLALLALLEGRFWLMLIAVTILSLSKKLILLIVPLILLTPTTKMTMTKLLLATFPAIAIYFLLHAFMNSSTPGGSLASGLSFPHIIESLKQFSKLNAWINLFLSFGLAWIPGLLALFCKDLPTVLRRWAILVPIVFVGVLAGLGNIARSTFTAAPVFIPIAAFGAEKILKGFKGQQPVKLCCSNDMSIAR